MRIVGFLFFVLCLLPFHCQIGYQERSGNTSEGPLKLSNYQEPHRPKIHFSPDSMWMNDPNGMVYYDGEYHLFYQYYPDSTVWGPMHWGHAISSDLVHWEHMPVALYPDEHGFIFSGSAVVDWQNTSGLGSEATPPIVAIFTYHNDEWQRTGRDDYQTQGIAYSTDRGRTWTKYRNNPVLENPGLRDFRDPKVMWYAPGQKWIMTFAAGDHVRFYSSPNLIDWTFESKFGKGIGAHDGVWECPDLFPLEVNGQKKWVLLVSINPGGPHGGSATQYFTGEFNGKNFVNDNADTTVMWLDYGRDNYAGVTWSDIPKEDGRRIFLGWMSNWSYATRVPTVRWRSAMTLPRRLELVETGDGLLLASLPVTELKSLREADYQLEPGGLNTESPTIALEIAAPVELILEFELSENTRSEPTSQFGVKLSNRLGEEMLIGYEPAENRFFTNRIKAGKSAFHEDFAKVHYAPYVNDDSIIRMHIFVDVSSVELFAENGKRVMTDIFFPEEDYDRLIIFVKNGDVKLNKSEIHTLATIW